MNVTTVELDDAMSVICAEFSGGAERLDGVAAENDMIAVPRGKAGEAPLDCTAATCGSGCIDLYRTKRAVVTQKKPTKSPINNRQSNSSRVEMAMSASVVFNGCHMLYIAPEYEETRKNRQKITLADLPIAHGGNLNRRTSRPEAPHRNR
ncbi:hypothetical protein PWP93_31015 [Paraburkholderia sp. A1RI-2L]|uniref:hypothetical protein n=1 Tax=Paraburkholderia sp. A1RI-2L TaxID=3028367 RepID=UPI003B7654CF